MTCVLLLTLIAGTPTHPMSCATPIFHELALGVDAPNRVTQPGLYNPPAVGEERTLWTWNMSVMPPSQFQTGFTCRGIGNHVYVMVHDSVWDAGIMDSTMVSQIIERFDNSSPRDSLHGVWHHNTTVLGQPPDEIDQDSLIYLLYYNIGTFHGTAFDGFWMSFDEYYDTTAMRLWGYHSNEIECVYVDCHPNDPSSDYRIAIAAHEFSHMIHWNYDRSESLWVNEGCAELAMWLFGTPDPVSGFPSSSDNDLTKWTGAWSDYIKTYLWFLYLYEQYGGRVGTDLIHDIVRSPRASIAGVNEGFDSTGVGRDFEQVFNEWVLANRVNDTSFGGEYGYYGETVPRFAVAGYHTSYPVDRTGGLSRWAGEYLLFQNGTNLELEFDGADHGDFRVFVVGLDTVGHRLLLDSVPLDSLQHGTYNVPGFDTAYQSVYLVPTNHDPYETMTYRYAAQATGIAETTTPERGRSGTRTATVVRSSIELRGTIPAVLFDVSGRTVAKLAPGFNDVRHASPGVYFLRTKDGALTDKLVISR